MAVSLTQLCYSRWEGRLGFGFSLALSQQLGPWPLASFLKSRKQSACQTGELESHKSVLSGTGFVAKDIP